jgi:glycosyltransferase involved in cell wall biosynthesis
MKVLYLPYNIASMQAITNEAMNNVPGVKSICLVYGSHKYNSPGPNMIELDRPSRRNPVKYIKALVLRYYYFIKLIFWADVVHYVWDSFLEADLDLKIIKWLKIPGVVEWVGSDIRCPSRAFPHNHYFRKIYDNGYEHRQFESDFNSNRRQEKFRKINFLPACAPEIQLYINKDYFEQTSLLMQRILTKNFVPKYPDIKNKKPLIIHSPSAKITKGSNLIIAAVEELKNQYDFDFLLLHNLPHEEVLQLMQKADIFIDAIIMGGYGMAAMEAMSYGKPVMCYLMPQVFEQGVPADCPIINTNPDNLKEQLVYLLTNPHIRHELGVKGRLFVEKYHDANKIAFQLADVYKDVISRSKERKVGRVALQQN